MKQVNWNVSLDESKLIVGIAKRACEKAKELGTTIDYLTMQMDITACHANGNPLKLQELLDADDFNFCHDVFGIRSHIDRDTGELQDFFSPRYSQPES